MCAHPVVYYIIHTIQGVWSFLSPPFFATRFIDTILLKIESIKNKRQKFLQFLMILVNSTLFCYEEVGRCSKQNNDVCLIFQKVSF